VVLTAGAPQGLSLAAGILRDRRDRALVEDKPLGELLSASAKPPF
jgi:hypothetical protein